MSASILALLLMQAGPLVTGGSAPPIQPVPLPRIGAGATTSPVAPAAPTAEPSRLELCLQAADENPLAAIEEAEEWLKLAKGSATVDPQLCRGTALSALERWDEAEAAYLAGRDAVPTSEPARRAQLGAAAAIAAGEAGAAARELALLDEAHADALRGGDPALAGHIALDRASPLSKGGRIAQAAAALAEARTALPGFYQAWLISARFSRQQKQLAEAQQQIERAADLMPVDPEIGLEAGIIAVLSGRDEAARKSWQSVIAAAPNSAIAKVAQSYIAQLGPGPASAAPALDGR